MGVEGGRPCLCSPLGVGVQFSPVQFNVKSFHFISFLSRRKQIMGCAHWGCASVQFIPSHVPKLTTLSGTELIIATRIEASTRLPS